MNLIFMRHGESMDNIKQILSSNNLACSFLTERGIEQVKTAVGKIKKIDKVYYSPLIRTIQTAIQHSEPMQHFSRSSIL